MDGIYYMAFSDFLVLRAITTLARSGHKITYEQIAKAVQGNCSASTVKRSVARLEQVKAIKRHGGGRKLGYRYEVLKADE